MQYICKRDCYVRNPQGTLQHFRSDDVVDYGEGVEVSEHFEKAGAKSDQPDEKEELRRKLKACKIDCPANATIATMRKKLKEVKATI